MQLARGYLIAALCALGVLAGASAAQAQAVKLVPNDTELVLTINIQQILNSEVAKANKTIIEIAKGKALEKIEEKGMDKFLKKAGFDPFKDLTSITVAVPGGRDPGESLIVLEGNFDADKIAAAVVASGEKVKIVTIADVKAFEVVPADEKVVYVGILSPRTMIACVSKADFAEAVGRLKGTKTASFKADTLRALLPTVNSKQSISIVATSNILVKLSEISPNADSLQTKIAVEGLKKIEGFSAGITIQKDIDFKVGVSAKDKETAAKYAAFSDKFVQDARGKVAKLAEQNEKLAPAVTVLQTIRSSAQGANLIITGQVTFDALEKLLSNLPIGN